MAIFGLILKIFYVFVFLEDSVYFLAWVKIKLNIFCVCIFER